MNDELARRRFEKSGTPADAKPLDVLKAVIAEIESGDQAMPDHIIVCAGRRDGDGETSRFWQGGTFGYHAMLGLLEEQKLYLRDGARS